MKNFTIVIPTKNESQNLYDMIQGCKKYSDSIIVVDGHSTDNTKEIAEKCGVTFILDNKKGKGAALRLAGSQAKNEIIVFIDADGSHDPNDIPKLIEPFDDDKIDLVIGSRMRGGSDELHGGFDEFFRLMGCSFITVCINKRYGVRLSDCENGFRAIKTDVFNKLGLIENIATIEQEMTMKALKLGYKVTEVPIHEYVRKYGNSTIVLRKVWLRFIYSFIKGLI